MATVRFDGIDDYVNMLAKLGNSSDETFKKMVKAGLRVVYVKIKSANITFSRYAKMKAAKKNEYGWFAQVQFRGKTSSGVPAALALNVYEHGKQGQQARPWLDAACASAESEAVSAMQDVYDEEVAKIGDA